jgi:hypothetical protein
MTGTHTWTPDPLATPPDTDPAREAAGLCGVYVTFGIAERTFCPREFAHTGCHVYNPWGAP